MDHESGKDLAGQFSLIDVRLGERGCPSSVWRIIRVLYVACLLYTSDAADDRYKV